MNYLTTVEMAKKWGISPRRVTLLCNEGRINGAQQHGRIWLIPEDVEKPADGRKQRGFAQKEQSGD